MSKSIPQNQDAERSVLGGVLLDNEALAEVQTIIGPEDFYRDAHRKVFEAMCSLARRAQPIDRVTLKAELDALGAGAAVGGEGFVDLLDKLVPSGANLSYYARIVAETALRRRVIQTVEVIAQEGYDQLGEVGEYVDRAESSLYALRSERAEHSIVLVRDLLEQVVKEVEEHATGSGVTGIPSGLTKLDALTCGFQPGELVVIAAATSMGKTALELTMARATAAAGGAVLFFSLEMPKKQIVLRLLAQEASVDLQHLRTGGLFGHEWPRIHDARVKLHQMQIEVNDSARNVLEIRALARREASRLAKTKTPLRAVVVDYLQLMAGDGRDGNREREVAGNSRELKMLAMELQLPVLVGSQVNRKCEERTNKRPQLWDLRESGSIEQDSDVVLFIYRGKRYEDESCPAGEAEIIVGKQRNGPPGPVKVGFVEESASFCDLGQQVSPAQLPLRAAKSAASSGA